MNRIEELVKEYENNKEHAQKYKSYINEVKGYNDYVFKEISLKEKFLNEEKWLKILMDMHFNSPELVGTYDQKIIITKKIDGDVIQDNDAQKHLYNIGVLIARLHQLHIPEEVDWKEKMYSEYLQHKEWAKDVMEKDLYSNATEFLDESFEELEFSQLAIIHRDIRPENIIISNGEYYLIDFESMCVGDIDYDFTRMFNLFNQKDFYKYDDFKNFIDGYKSIKDIHLSEKKWELYNVFYAFRMYTRILVGIVKRDSVFEAYLRTILNQEQDKVSEWIMQYDSK